MKELTLSMIVIFSGTVEAFANILAGRFGPNQIFDVQYYYDVDTLIASSFIAPLDSEGDTVVFGEGQYMAFFLADPEALSYGIGLYNSNGTLDRIIHESGEIQSIGPDAIFYLGSDRWGTVITPTQGFSFGDSASFANMNSDVTATLLNTYSSLGNAVLNAGESSGPPTGSVLSETFGTLERVLASIDAANLVTINGTFANIAENIGRPGTPGIDASITNVITGITTATQQAVAAGDVTAFEWNMPSLNFGDMATTALGAVNTGEITLGVNSIVDEAQTRSTRAVSSALTQLGGSADTGVLVLNVASNMSGIDGSISNTITAINGTIGDLSTTALGAVNTGTITSGVNAAVQGIVGISGQTGSASGL